MVHAAMEPRGAVATYRNGTYTIWMSTQMAYVDQFWYSRCLGVSENHVRVIKPLVGGGFGGKLDSYSFGLPLLRRQGNCLQFCGKYVSAGICKAFRALRGVCGF